MMRKQGSILVRWAILASSLAVAVATPIQFHNTGLAAVGANDPWWTLQSGGPATVLGDTVIATNASNGWIADNATSSWIGNVVTASQPLGQAANFVTPAFIAQTQFTVDSTRLTGLLSSTVVLAGRVGFDDCGFVYLNGNIVMQDCGGGAPGYTPVASGTSFSNWTPVSITAGLLLANQVNTLVVYEYNTGGQYGARLELTDVPSAIPEPLTMGTVLIGLGLLISRRKFILQS